MFGPPDLRGRPDIRDLQALALVIPPYMNHRIAPPATRRLGLVVCVAAGLASACAVLPSRALAQASITVPTTDRVYRDIRLLIGHDLVDTLIVGQQPYSRMTIARVLLQARRNLTHTQADLGDRGLSPDARRRIEARLRHVESVLGRAERDFRAEMDQLATPPGTGPRPAHHPLAGIEISLIAANSPPRDAINANLGFNDAVVNPLLHHRQGRNVVDGGTASVETVHWTQVSRQFAMLARPRFQISKAFAPQPNINEVKLQNLYARVALGNIEVLLGRDNLAWGQGRDPGLLISNNARGMDMIKISNGRPLTLPWLFRLLGPTKFSLFVAHLGSQRFLPNSYMVGYKVSIRPHRQLELGFTATAEAGGTGAPQASLVERIADPLLFVDLVFLTSSDFQFSDKRVGFDVRFRIPQARGLELFGESVFDDIRQANLKGMFTQDAGYVVGAHLPRVVPSGIVDLTLEYHFAGIRLYRHAQFRSGHTLDGVLIGDELESAGRAGYMELNWDVSARDLITVEAAYEARSADDYRVIEDRARSIPLQSIKVRSNPQERRYRGVISWSHWFEGRPFLLKTSIGYERANTFAFQLGRNRHNLIGELKLDVSF